MHPSFLAHSQLKFRSFGIVVVPPKKTFFIKPGKFILYYVEPFVCAETACECVGTHKRVENSVNFQRKFSLAAYLCICKNSIA